MKQLTNSDQVNIESYKGLLTMLQNDTPNIPDSEMASLGAATIPVDNL